MAEKRMLKESSINRELAAVILGALMPSMDTTIVAIGISTFMESFHANESAVQWVSTAYLLALAVVIPATGWAEEKSCQLLCSRFLWDRFWDRFFPGFLLLAGSITALLLGMTEISQGKGMFRFDTTGILLIGIVLLIAFLLLPSTRDSGNAIVNVHFLKYRSVAAASAAMFFAGGTLYAAQFLFPLFWKNTLDASALEAAFMLLPQGVGALLTRTAAGRLTDRYGGHIVATGGFLACVITTAGFLIWGNAAHSFWLYGILFARGLAIGMLIVPITTSAFQGLPDLDVPGATVIIRAFQQATDDPCYFPQKRADFQYCILHGTI